MKGLFFKKHHIEAFKKIFFLKKLSSGLGKQNSIVLAGHLNCIISSLTYAPNYLSLWVISFLFAHSCLCLQCMLVLHIALPIRCRNYDMFNLAFFFSEKEREIFDPIGRRRNGTWFWKIHIVLVDTSLGFSPLMIWHSYWLMSSLLYSSKVDFLFYYGVNDFDLSSLSNYSKTP